MVKKMPLQRSVADFLKGNRDLAFQGVGRTITSLMVQQDELAPEGESVIPVIDIAGELNQAREALEQKLATNETKLAAAQERIEQLRNELKDLDETIDNLVLDPDGLGAAGEVLKAEIERVAGLAETAQAAAFAARETADAADARVTALAGKAGRLIRSTEPPTGSNADSGNLWLDTTTGVLHSWTGTEWEPLEDPRVADALDAAEGAKNAAATAATRAEEAARLAEQAGELASTATGVAEAARADATAANAAAAAAESNAATAQAAAANASGKAEEAAQNAAAAAGIAEGKADVFIQDAEPPKPARRGNTLWIDTRDGLNTPRRWDGKQWLAVNDKQALTAAADAARALERADAAVQQAVEAHAAAGKAVSEALRELNEADAAAGRASTLDGRYTVAPANPTAEDGRGKPVGAVWEVRSGGTSLRRFVWGPSGWQMMKAGQDFIGERAIGTAQIADAAIGTAQIADLAVTNAKVGDLNAGKITAGIVNAERIAVGTSENLIPNGAGEWGRAAGWAEGMGWSASSPDGTPGAFVSAVGQNRLANSAPLEARSWPVEPDTEYAFEFWARADKANSGLVISFDGQDGKPGVSWREPENRPSEAYAPAHTQAYAYPVVTNLPTTWTRYGIVVKTNPNVHSLRFGRFEMNAFNGSEKNTIQRFAGLRFMKRSGGELIVDGSISTRKLIADTVSANNAAFIDAMMQDLTVKGAANLNEVTANALYTKLGIVEKLQVTDELVTARMIAKGAINANHIEANSIESKHIAVDAINAKHKIVGATIMTAEAGSRTVIDSRGVQVYGDNVQPEVQLGFGAPTGLQLRNPNTRRLEPISRQVLGGLAAMPNGPRGPMETLQLASDSRGDRRDFPNASTLVIPNLRVNQTATYTGRLGGLYTSSEGKFGRIMFKMYVPNNYFTVGPGGIGSYPAPRSRFRLEDITEEYSFELMDIYNSSAPKRRIYGHNIIARTENEAWVKTELFPMPPQSTYMLYFTMQVKRVSQHTPLAWDVRPWGMTVVLENL